MKTTETRPEHTAVTRKLAYAAAGWVSGLFFYLGLGYYSIFLITIAGALASAIFFRKKYFNFIITVLMSAAMGCCYFSAYHAMRYEKITAFDGKTVQIDGYVADREYSEGSLRLTVKGRINGGVRTKITFFTDDASFDYCDRVTAKIKVKTPENTVKFNGEDYARSQGVFLQGDGTADSVTKVGGCSDRFLREVKRLRDLTEGQILKNCGERPGAFLTAVLCADRSHTSVTDNAAVYRSGLGHLFAVSGTHVVMISSFLGAVLSLLIPSKKIRSAVLLAVIWSFSLFAGFSLSVVRACIMMSVSQTAPFFRRRSDPANSLGAAAMLITLNCPYAVTSVSFLLSFTAAFAFGVVSPALCKGRTNGKYAEMFISYICINICSMPLCACFFSEISLISVFVNILLLPMCTAALMLSLFYMLSGFKAVFLIKFAGRTAQCVLDICCFAAKSRFSYTGTTYKKTLVILGIFAVCVTVFAALKRDKKRIDISRIVAVYLAVCIGSAILGEVKTGDKIIIFPDDRSYTATVLSGRSALVFDIGAKADNARNVDSLLRQYHISHSNIFISDSAVYSYISYSHKLAVKAEYFSPDVSGKKIERMDGEMSIDNFIISPEEDGFSVRFSDCELIFTDEQISINGEVYSPERFEWTSEIGI